METHRFLRTLLAFLGILAMAACTPVSPRPETSELRSIGRTLKKRNNDCSDATFNNNTASYSAPVADCQQMRNNIVGSGTWTLQPGEALVMIKYGNCSLSMGNQAGSDFVYVGNDDLRDLIADSITKFSFGDQVSTYGDVLCQSSLVLTNRWVHWQLFFNPFLPQPDSPW